MSSRTAIAASIAAGLLLLAGCATSPIEPATGPPPSSAPSAADVAPDGAAETAAPTATAGAYVEYTDGAIEATPGAKALFFHASWCPQCRALDDELTADGAPDGLTVFKVDFDDRVDLRQRYGVTLQTTVVFVDDDGTAISSIVLYDDPSIASLVAALP